MRDKKPDRKAVEWERERKKIQREGVIDKVVQRMRSQLGGYPHQLFAAGCTRKNKQTNNCTFGKKKTIYGKGIKV